MNPNFRAMARESLTRAELQIAVGNDHSLRYAVLELRLVIEGLTYARAMAFKDDIPPSEWKKWQPQKVMEMLLQIDPHADIGGTLAIGLEEEYGVPAKEMTVVGSEHVLSMQVIKKHYHWLGSFLHLPTRRQLDEGDGPDWRRVRSTCEALLSELGLALSSNISDMVFGLFIEIPCSRCRTNMRRRVPEGNFDIFVECFECHAPHRLSSGAGAGQVRCNAVKELVRCRTSGCDGVESIWQNEIKAGFSWNCQKCDTRFKLALGVFPADLEPIGDTDAKERT